MVTPKGSMSTEGETLQVSVLTGARFVHPWWCGRCQSCCQVPATHVVCVDMLPFVVTIQATVPQKSEIPEGLMNYPVFIQCLYHFLYRFLYASFWYVVKF